MLKKTNMGILLKVFDFMYVHFFHCQMVNLIKCVTIFGVDNSSLVHADNGEKKFFFLKTCRWIRWHLICVKCSISITRLIQKVV